jgi:hypothetical protein
MPKVSHVPGARRIGHLTLLRRHATIALVQRTGAFRPGRRLVLTALVLGFAATVLLFACSEAQAVVLTPGDGAAAVPITTPIRLTFAQPMDHASVEDRFRIEPAVTGKLVWQDKEVIFYPQGALAPDTTYTVVLEAGALSERERPLNQGQTWRFHTRAPQLLYLGRVSPGDDVRQLFVAPLDGTPPRQLTDQPWGVWDYATHPLGEAVVYSVLREDGGSDLWRMDRDGADQRVLLACPNAACLNPAWSPDGRQLAYERRDIWHDAPNLDPRAGRIWLLDVQRGKEEPLFDYEVPAHSPVWSPDGGRLAYASPELPGIEVYSLHSQDLKQYGNEWGTAPTWSPDGQQLVMPDLLLIGGEDSAGPSDQPPDHEGEALAVRLVSVDVESGKAVDISGGDDLVKDTGPAWSPQGGWIAIARQFLDEARWTPGRQIWLVRPDASEAYSLVSEPMADHFAFAWRPDGGMLAYLRTNLAEGPQPVPDVSVWLFDFSQGKPVLVANQGVLPRWLP